MKTVVHMLGWNRETQSLQLVNFGDNLEVVKFADNVLMAIDGSTTCSGVAFLRTSDGAYCGSIAFIHEKGETAVEYKVAWKRALHQIFRQTVGVLKTVVYEEPFIGYANAAKNLLMLRTSVEELIAENKSELSYIQYFEVANGRWKKRFLAPDKVPSGTDAQKKAIRDKILSSLPFLDSITQDECDATGLGFVTAKELSNGSEEDLKSKKKIRPFQYNIEFYGADTDDGALEVIANETRAPEKLMELGFGFTAIERYQRLDDLVCQVIGEDDTVQIIRLPSSKCGNIALKYRISHLTEAYEYLYLVVWRKSRK